jgi:hypothetical protein
VPVHIAVIENVVTPNPVLAVATPIFKSVVPVGVVFDGENKLVTPDVGRPEIFQLRLPQFGSNEPDGKVNCSPPLWPGSSLIVAAATGLIGPAAGSARAAASVRG